mmetsp:Transcript_32076/g.67436  ORF Transcript_32076/g.67436 Transcript_32076/m.67436 type:complete len:104 (-) Transcript_32076:3325-3636(-)
MRDKLNQVERLEIKLSNSSACLCSSCDGVSREDSTGKSSGIKLLMTRHQSQERVCASSNCPEDGFTLAMILTILRLEIKSYGTSEIWAILFTLPFFSFCRHYS